MRVYLHPRFEGEDKGDGGVRRVVEAQRKYLPRYGVEFVDDPSEADVLGLHIMAPESFLRRFPDKPVVAHTHGLYWSEYQWEEWAYKANQEVLKLICSANVTTAPTEWVAEVIRRHTARDVRVVPHGVDMREWQPAASHRGYVLWNKTRPDPVCDPEPLNLLARAMPDQSFVTTFGNEASNVQVVGRVAYEAGKQLVRHAGVYLCTTRETFGIGTIEAMASGVPIVGYRFGGQAEFIEHGVTGWLVQPGDIDGLAEGVRWALENRQVVGAACNDRAKDFMWQNAAKQYRAIYNEVCEAHEKESSGPRTTVVVTAYNLDKYLGAALSSVASQTDDSWECIVVDDASPDSCGAIADQWAKKDRRFRVIHNSENLYLAEARNVAIDQAKGRYILPLDADDMLAPDAIRILADALDVDRTLNVAYGNVFFTEEDGVTPTDYGVLGQPPGHSGWPVPFDAAKQIRGMNLLPYSSMYRKEAWRLIGGYRRRLRTAEDADFWTRLASFAFRATKITDRDTLIYRNREGSMSRENEAIRHDYIRWFPWSKEERSAPAAIGGPKKVSLFTPRVSVVIPVGPGHERYVQDAVDSVLAQSYPYWECIVVNDSGNNLNRLPSFVRVIDSDKRDTGGARNLGVGAARGDVFLPLDADDFLQPDALQWLTTAHIQSKGEIIYPDFWEDPDEPGKWKAYQLDDWECGHLTRRGSIHSVVALTPVEVWRQVGGYAEGINWEDWDFQMRCANAGFCTRRLASPLFNYRKWTGKRRDWKDGDDFEQRKQAMLERWGDFFDGRKQFMACACSGKTISPAKASANGNGGAPKVALPDAVMIEYTGGKAGTVRYRSPSGTIYTFSSFERRKWVKGEDVQMFARLQGFRVVADDSGPVTAQAGAVPALSV